MALEILGTIISFSRWRQCSLSQKVPVAPRRFFGDPNKTELSSTTPLIALHYSFWPYLTYNKKSTAPIFGSQSFYILDICICTNIFSTMQVLLGSFKFVIKDIFITLLHYYIMQLTPDYPRWSLAGESQKIKIPIKQKIQK